MAIRMIFPADVNPDPDAKFARGMAEAFPFDPHLSLAPAGFPVPNRPSLWLCAALMVLITLALSGCGSAEAQPASASITAEDIKRAAAGAWNCPGMHAEWEGTTVYCLKESP
ncbi:hypothetical protein [Comamonas antarctica]|uniref:hypothetical protein n=1 Tax=Comamonas antarctica TaxID=2743470 RepID=UPI0028EC057A|nr:hypothetical protein [Comamonas antarctica]